MNLIVSVEVSCLNYEIMSFALLWTPQFVALEVDPALASELWRQCTLAEALMRGLECLTSNCITFSLVFLACSIL